MYLMEPGGHTWLFNSNAINLNIDIHKWWQEKLMKYHFQDNRTDCSNTLKTNLSQAGVGNNIRDHMQIQHGLITDPTKKKTNPMSDI